MRLRLLFFVLFTCSVFISYGQQDCTSAVPICQNIVQGRDPLGTGLVEDLTSVNWACITEPEHNSHFYILNVVSSGTLVFTIRPDRITPARTRLDSIADFDFAVWEVTPTNTSGGCAPCDIVHGTEPIRCNWAGLVPGVATYAQTLTGLSTTATTNSSGINGPQFNSAITATAGQTYIIMIDQYDPTYALDYKIDFTGSTAGISGTTPPSFTAAGTPCGYAGDNLVANFLEMIQVSSVAANGSDFYVTDAAGARINAVAAKPLYNTGPTTQRLFLQFGAVLPAGNYVLHAEPGSDGNTVLDLCGNQQLTTDSWPFTLGVAPNPPQIKAIDTPACKKVRLVLTRPVTCNSIAADGSDFIITGPENVRITSAMPLHCTSVSRNCSGPVSIVDTIDLAFTKSITRPGTYTLHIGNGSDGNPVMDTCMAGISNTVTFVVSDKGYVTSAATPTLLCNPGYASLDATIAPAAAVLPGINWTPGTFLSDSTAGNTLAYVPATATYTVQIQDTNGCYRRSSSTVTVSVRHPEIGGVDTAVCAGTTIQLSAAGGDAYSWYPAAGLSCTTCTDPLATPATTTTYHVVITDALGCSDTLSRTITIHPLPVISAGRDTSVVYGTQLQLYAYTPAGKYYLWDPIAGLNNANIPNPVLNAQASMDYVVYVVDTNYCKNSDTMHVTVRTDIPLTVPSGFTPNNDGRNDRFRVVNLTFQKVIEFRVFNRWGQEVYAAADNKGWDGTTNGAQSDAGDYKYLIRVAGPDSRTETFTGNVTLIR